MNNRRTSATSACALMVNEGVGFVAQNFLAVYRLEHDNRTFTSSSSYNTQHILSRRLEEPFMQLSNIAITRSNMRDEGEGFPVDVLSLSPCTDDSYVTLPNDSGNMDNNGNTKPVSNVAVLKKPLKPFLPSTRAEGGRREPDPIAMRRAMRRVQAFGVTRTSLHNYKGSFDKFCLESIAVPEQENCCLFIMKIHPSVQYDLQKFFAQIYHGKVFSFSLNPPEGRHYSCAAKLAFMNRASAEHFMNDTATFPGIRIHGMRLKGIWNREKVCPTAEHARKSRVVCFAGPDLTLKYLEWIFRGFVYYDLIACRNWLSPCAPSPTGFEYEKVVEMHFSSLRGQSQMAVLCFQKYFEGDARYHYWYGEDPCGP